MNPILPSGSEEPDIVCGFQEMPGWSTAHPKVDLSLNVMPILETGSPIMNFLAPDGLIPVGSTPYISGS